MTSHRTSAKSAGIPKKPRRVQLICPACGARFSLSYSDYRKHIRAGTLSEKALEEVFANQEHDATIAQAAREKAVEEWRDNHPEELIWMTPEEEEARIRKEEREKFAKELLWYCRKAMEADSMLFEFDQVPMSDVEYATIQLREGKPLRSKQEQP